MNNTHLSNEHQIDALNNLSTHLLLNEIFMKKLILIFIIGMLVSCERKGIDNLNSGDFKMMHSNELFKKVEVIPLETNMDAMNYSVKKLICTKSNIFVLGFRNAYVTMYDNEGNFLRNIGVKGKGPGELLDVRDFEVNRFSGNIELCGNIISTIMVYDTLGNFLENKSLPKGIGSVKKFFNINEDLVFLLAPSCKEGIVLVVCTKSSKIMAATNTYIDVAYINFLNSKAPFSYYNNYCFFTDIYSGIVYYYNEDKASFVTYKEFIYNDLVFDKSILPSPQRWRELSVELRREFVDEVSNYVHQTDMYLENSTHSLYRKRGADIILTNKTTKQTKKFNSIDEGMSLSVIGMNDDYIYGLVGARNVSKYITEEMVGKAKYDKITNLKDDDNGVIIKYYFK